MLGMESLLLRLYILALGICGAIAKGPGKISPTSDTDPQFHHRAFHATAVLGDYLYIDGGEIATWNGVGKSIQTVNPQNGTKQGDIWIRASTCWLVKPIAQRRMEALT